MCRDQDKGPSMSTLKSEKSHGPACHNKQEAQKGKQKFSKGCKTEKYNTLFFSKRKRE